MSFRQIFRPGLAAFLGLFDHEPPSSASAQQTPAATTTTVPRTILFLGDSLSAGYGLDNAATQAFPALVQRKIDDARLDYKVVNAGLSGDTTAGGVRRIDWLLQRPVDVLVLELGGNDGLRGLPTPETEKNLQAIIDKTRAKNPAVKIVVAGMRMPPNFGDDYVARFVAVFATVAKNTPGAVLLPFILEGVGGDPRLNQRDQIHPTAEGTRSLPNWSGRRWSHCSKSEVGMALRAGPLLIHCRQKKQKSGTGSESHPYII